MLNKLDQWHKTRTGYAIFGLLEAVVAYGFFGLSIDRGNFFWYLLTLIFLVGALNNLFKLLGTFVPNKDKKRGRK